MQVVEKASEQCILLATEPPLQALDRELLLLDVILSPIDHRKFFQEQRKLASPRQPHALELNMAPRELSVSFQEINMRETHQSHKLGNSFVGSQSSPMR